MIISRAMRTLSERTVRPSIRLFNCFANYQSTTGNPQPWTPTGQYPATNAMIVYAETAQRLTDDEWAALMNPLPSVQQVADAVAKGAPYTWHLCYVQLTDTLKGRKLRLFRAVDATVSNNELRPFSVTLRKGQKVGQLIIAVAGAVIPDDTTVQCNFAYVIPDTDLIRAGAVYDDQGLLAQDFTIRTININN